MTVLASHVVIQQRFHTRRAFATGVAALGISVGGFIGPHIVEALLEQYGARGTLAIIGAMHANCIPLALQFRSPSSALTHRSAKVDILNL